MPLAVCFALAAVLSPTDVVAATAMMTNVPVPRRLQRILEGEALFNDASGLVCLRLAVAAAMTGAFPFWPSVGGLVWAALGGIAIGLLLSQLISLMKFRIALRLGEDTSSYILISLLTPDGAYLLAEAAGCSPRPGRRRRPGRRPRPQRRAGISPRWRWSPTITSTG